MFQANNVCFVRLPIYQGSSYSFLVPALALFDLKRNPCPAPLSSVEVDALGLTGNTTWYGIENEQGGNYSTFDQVWQSRVREVQVVYMLFSLTIKNKS